MAETDDGLISFKWNNHKNTFFHVLATLRCKETYTDATLACEGKFFPVHKLVMSTCSDYFAEVFEKAACKSPVVILKDIRQQDLDALLDYMYLGEVDIQQSELSELLRAAECLRIKGLAVPDYLTYATPTKNYVGTQHANDSGQSYPDDGDNVTSNDESDVVSPPKKIKIEEQPSKSTENSEHTSPPTPTTPSNENVQPSHLQLFMTPPPLPFPLSPSNSSENKLPNNVTPVLVTPTKPIKSTSQKRKISVRTPQSSKLAKALKMIKNPRNEMRKTKMIKTGGPSSTLPRNHKDYYFKHEEKNIIGQKPSESETETKYGNNSKTSPETLIIPRKRRRASKFADPNLVAEKAKTSLILSASLANFEEKQEPIIPPEEFCRRIGLPHFPSAMLPVLEGHELNERERYVMANQVIEELICHFKKNHMFSVMCNRSLRGKFYKLIKEMIMEKYPKNVLEDDSQKKGPLGVTLSKVAERMNRRTRIELSKLGRSSSPSTLNPTASSSRSSNSQKNLELKERKKSTQEKKVSKKKETLQVQAIKKENEEPDQGKGERIDEDESKENHDQSVGEGSQEQIRNEKNGEPIQSQKNQDPIQSQKDQVQEAPSEINQQLVENERKENGEENEEQVMVKGNQVEDETSRAQVEAKENHNEAEEEQSQEQVKRKEDLAQIDDEKKAGK